MSEAVALERIADEYLRPDPGRVVDSRFQDWSADRLIEWVQGPDVLELGVGDEQWTGKVVGRFGRTHIVDASPSLLTSVKETFGTRVTTYTSLFEDFSPPKQFHGVVASFVLEHVEDPVRVLRRAAGWLAPDGRILVIVPHADSLHRRLAVAMGMQQRTDELGATDQRLGHRRVYSIPLLEQHLTEAGLKIHRKRGLIIKPLPQGMLAHFTPEMLEGFMKLGDQLPMELAAAIAYDCGLQK